MRQDQIDTFIVIATGERASWAPARGGVYHATPDGIHALCKPYVGVSESNPSNKTNDRSNNAATCEACAEMVRRKRVRAG